MAAGFFKPIGSHFLLSNSKIKQDEKRYSKYNLRNL